MVGILPAAGLGTRLGSRVCKELLVVDFDGQRPVTAAEHALDAFADAGADRAIVVVADHKLELVRVLGPGDRLPIAYVHRAPRGLADAVAAALPWVGDETVCLALPDTRFRPADAVARVHDELVASGADLVLGVFPTERPEALGPVRVDDGVVREVLDKPASTELRNTWGVAAWGPRFSALLSNTDTDASIGLVFDDAVKSGLVVRALEFADGHYLDVGDPRVVWSVP